MCKRRSLLPVLLLTSALPFLQGGSCIGEVKKPINRGLAAIEHAIDVLDQQSTSWQGTMKELERQLIADGQDTLAHEVTQLMQRGIATTGAELRCNADFVGARMRDGLARILARLQDRGIPPVRPWFCQVSPTRIELAVPSPQRRNVVEFYGYNLDAQGVAVYHEDSSGLTRVPQQMLASPTHYLLTVNVSDTNGIVFNPSSSRLVFKWNDTEIHSILVVTAPPPCGGRGEMCCSSEPVCKDGGVCQAGTCAEPPPPDPKPLFTVQDDRYERNGMISCPPGSFMAGYHYNDNRVLCDPNIGVYTEREESVDAGTPYMGMHACPEGYGMTGIHANSNRFNCAPVRRAHTRFLDPEPGRPVTQLFGMHSCPEGTFMIGYHHGKNQYTCGRLSE